MAVAITTKYISKAGLTTATMVGQLTNIGGQASVDCYFQYRLSGAGSWNDTSTDAITISATEENFSTDILESEFSYTWCQPHIVIKQDCYIQAISLYCAGVGDVTLTLKDNGYNTIDTVVVANSSLSWVKFTLTNPIKAVAGEVLFAHFAFPSSKHYRSQTDVYSGAYWGTVAYAGDDGFDYHAYAVGLTCIPDQVFSNSITSLTQNETYEYRAVAEYDDGGTQYAYGDTEEFDSSFLVENGIGFSEGVLSDTVVDNDCLSLKEDVSEKYDTALVASVNSYTFTEPRLVAEQSFYLTHVRFYIRSSGEIVLTVRDTSDNVLDTVYNYKTVGDGWVEFELSDPIYYEEGEAFRLRCAFASNKLIRKTNYLYSGSLWSITTNYISNGSTYTETPGLELIGYKYNPTGYRQKPYALSGTWPDVVISWVATTPTDTSIAVQAQVQSTASVTGESVGTGDGTEDTFTLDYWPIGTVTMYVNGIEETDFSQDGNDPRIIVFDSPPGNTLSVTADYIKAPDPVALNWEAQISGNPITVPDESDNVDNKVLWVKITLSTSDIAVGATLSSLLLEEEAASNNTTGLLDGKVTIKSSATNLFDGTGVVKSVATNLLDGKAVVGAIDTDLFDGKAILKSLATALFDGKAILKSLATALFDGKAVIKSIDTDLFDGTTRIFLTASNLFDGTVYLYLEDTDLFDGRVLLSELATGAFDGKAVVKDVATGLFDGKGIIKDAAIGLFDGKTMLRFCASNLFDGNGIVVGGAETTAVFFDAKTRLVYAACGKPAFSFTAAVPGATASIAVPGATFTGTVLGVEIDEWTRCTT
jgi:hypothetical protein